MSKASVTTTYRIRAAERLNLSFTASVVLPCGLQTNVVIRNISSAGIAMQTSEILPIGSPANLKIGSNLAFPVSVRWQVGGIAGAEFTPRITWRKIQAIILAASRAQCAEAA